MNLCNKVILMIRISHTSRKEQREARCIFCCQVKKKTDLIDKTLFFFFSAEANIWKFNVFIFIFCMCESK